MIIKYLGGWLPIKVPKRRCSAVGSAGGVAGWGQTQPFRTWKWAEVQKEISQPPSFRGYLGFRECIGKTNQKFKYQIVLINCIFLGVLDFLGNNFVQLLWVVFAINDPWEADSGWTLVLKSPRCSECEEYLRIHTFTRNLSHSSMQIFHTWSIWGHTVFALLILSEIHRSQIKLGWRYGFLIESNSKTHWVFDPAEF